MRGGLFDRRGACLGTPTPSHSSMAQWRGGIVAIGGDHGSEGVIDCYLIEGEAAKNICCRKEGEHKHNIRCAHLAPGRKTFQLRGTQGQSATTETC